MTADILKVLYVLLPFWVVFWCVSQRGKVVNLWFYYVLSVLGGVALLLVISWLNSLEMMEVLHRHDHQQSAAVLDEIAREWSPRKSWFNQLTGVPTTMVGYAVVLGSYALYVRRKRGGANAA